MSEIQLITKDGECFLLTEDTKTISLKEAVGTLAICTYASLLNLQKETDSEEKKRLEEKITFQSNLLDSLSNALLAVRN